MRIRVSLITLVAALGITTSAHADPPEIQSVEVRGQGESAEILIRGAFDVPTYAVRARDSGRTIVVDVAGASLPEGGVDMSGATSLISGVVSSTTSRGVRIELSLTEAARYRARANHGRIVVELGAGSAEPSDDAARRRGRVTVRDVHFERRDGRDRLVVELSGPAQFRVVPNGDGPARMEIRGAGLSPRLDRSVPAPDRSPVRRARVARDGSRAVIEVDRLHGVTGTAIREGNRIVWLFSEARGENVRPRSRTIAREEAIHVESDTAEVAAFLSDVPLQVRGSRGRRRYSGRRIDLDFKDADIHNILRLLAEVGGVNIVTADDVAGTVTIRMRNVPWDQALLVILQAKGLGMVRRNNLIRVAPLSTLEKERESAIAKLKQERELEPLETRLVPVSYATAEELSPRVRELLTERGTVSVDARTNVMIVRDITRSLDDVEELVRTLDTQTPQVLIEARIVEATSQYTRDVGIQWGGDAVYSTANGNPTGIAFPHNVGVVGGASDTNTPTAGLSPFTTNLASPPNFLVNLPAITGTGQGGALGVTLGSVGGNVNLNVRLSAAEANGVVRIISSPRILTLDNHEASIAQGTLIPFSQVSAQGVNTAFQEAKLELTVRPHVTADGSVSMHVNITRDEPDFTRTSARGDPTILKREAETDLLIPDGHTAVIGGIYTRNTGRNVDQIPFFGDIPLLGVLFQRRRVRDDRNELLIFITPRIVNRAEALPQ